MKEIILDSNIIDEMKAKGYQHLVLETEMRYVSACLGYNKTVKVRFSDEKEENLLEEGYSFAITEVGKVYYKEEEIWLGDRPQMKLVKLPWEQKFEFMGIRAVK